MNPAAALCALYALSLAGCAASSDAGPKAALESAREAYLRCTLLGARALAERSGEAPESIATAVLSACGPEDSVVLQAYRADAPTPTVAMVAMQRLRDAAHAQVVGDVVARRTARRALR